MSSKLSLGMRLIEGSSGAKGDKSVPIIGKEFKVSSHCNHKSSIKQSLVNYCAGSALGSQEPDSRKHACNRVAPDGAAAHGSSPSCTQGCPHEVISAS
jgi:hypothetical protein